MINQKENPEFLNQFLNYSAVILNKSPNSIIEYNYDLVNFFKFMSNHLGYSSCENLKEIDIHELDMDFLRRITLDDIHAYLFYVKSTFNNKPATIARKASTIRIFFSYMTKSDSTFIVNPAQNLESPKIGKRIPRNLTLEESQKLLQITANEDKRNGIRDYAIITIFLNCGLRLSELVGINTTDIKFDECKMTVIGKGNKERVIPLNKACMSAINDYIAIRPPKDKIKSSDQNALFLSSRLERIGKRTVQHVVEDELKRAGIDTKKFSTHKLRHTAATLMYQYGNVDIRALQELLGHQSIATTEIYTHVSNEQVVNAVESNPLANITIHNQL